MEIRKIEWTSAEEFLLQYPVGVFLFHLLYGLLKNLLTVVFYPGKIFSFKFAKLLKKWGNSIRWAVVALKAVNPNCLHTVSYLRKSGYRDTSKNNGNSFVILTIKNFLLC